MKKILLVALLGIIVSNMAFGFFGLGKKKDTVYVYNWSEYIPEELITRFEEEYDCKVVYDVYSSNEEMYAKLKAGGGGYDVVFPSGDYTSIMINEGMAEELDKSKIPNFENIDKSILEKITFDKGNMFSVPYVMGAAGIAVNTKYVKDYPKDYSIYKMEEYKGRMTLLDDMREVLGNALKGKGYSVNTRNKKELEEAKQEAIEWKKNILKYDAESFGKGFAAEEYWVVQCYAENVYLELDEEGKKNFDFFIPEDGGTMYIDSMMILKDAKNKDLAYKFINFIHDEKVYAEIADWLTLPSLNVAARKHMTETPVYTVEDMANCEFIGDLGEDVEVYDKIWQEIVIEN